ncbi:MAG: hypothetical protein B7Y99_06275 [Caulobacterales bacterium 32-69-10]|nr:MAG: hypothetical protein B7Y99_06275 [Caulobacterales bacterium 32-69-10]
MGNRRARRAFLVGLALVLAAPIGASAHHSGAMFDREKTVSTSGVLKEVDWSNPHIHLVLETGAAESWWFEGNPPAWFQRAGVKRADFAKGLTQKVTIEHHPLKDGRPGGSLVAVVYADGSRIKVE